jgi:hypothetical protein
MFEDERTTRLAICGTGILLALIFFLAHLPVLLLIVPAGILFLGLVADPYETHAVWYGILNALGIFDLSALNEGERLIYAGKRHYFWFGEVVAAAALAGLITVPAGFVLLDGASPPLAFTGAALIFLLLFVFLPKLIRYAMKADTDAAIEAFGKNEQVKKVFWSVFAALAGLVLAGTMDPAIVQKIVWAILLAGG